MSKLSDIFDKDPLNWTPEDIEAAIAYLKERQANPHMFKKGGTPKKAAAKKVAGRTADPRQIDLEELIRDAEPEGARKPKPEPRTEPETELVPA